MPAATCQHHALSSAHALQPCSLCPKARATPDGSNAEMLLLRSPLPDHRRGPQQAHLQPPAHNVQRVSNGLPSGASHCATAQAGDDAQLAFVLQLCSQWWGCKGLEASVQCCVQLQRMRSAARGAADLSCMQTQISQIDTAAAPAHGRELPCCRTTLGACHYGDKVCTGAIQLTKGCAGLTIVLEHKVLQRLIDRKIEAHVRDDANHAGQPTPPQSNQALLQQSREAL